MKNQLSINSESNNENKKRIKIFSQISETPLEDEIHTDCDKNASLERIFTKIELNPSDEKVNTNEKEQTEMERIFHKKIFTKIEVSPTASSIESLLPEENRRMLPKIQKLLIKQKNEENFDEDDGFGNFTLSIYRQTIEFDENEKDNVGTFFYFFTIKVNNLGSYNAKVAGYQIDTLTWISKATGGAAYINTNPNSRKQVIKLVHSLISKGDYEVCKIYRQNGWKEIDGEWKYVINTGIIGQPHLRIMGDYERTFEYVMEDIGKKTTFDKAMGMIKICNDETITLPLSLFTHTGCLCKLFELAKVPIKGAMAVIGATNSRKTSMVLCLTKTFCRENITTPEITFESTSAGIEVESSKHPDSILMIDDFHPAISTKAQNQLLEKLENILRRYGDRVSKKRMTDFTSGNARGSYEVHGLCVITGEDIGGVQSALTRVLTLEINQESVNNDILSYYQNFPLILNSHLYDFISYVTLHFDEIVMFISKRVWELRRTKPYAISRFSEYYAQLMTTAEIISKYALSRGFWSQETSNTWLSHCENIIDTVIKKNLVNIIRENFATMVIQALKYGIEKYGVINIDNVKKHQLTYAEMAEDENHIYVQGEFLLELTKKYWQSFGKDIPFSTKKSLIAFLEHEKLILVRREGDDIRRTLPIPRGKQRVLYIKKEKMKELLEKVEL